MALRTKPQTRKPRVVPLQSPFQQLAERLRLREVLRLAPLDLVGHELFEELQAQVLMRLVLESLEELVVEDRDIGLLQYFTPVSIVKANRAVGHRSRLREWVSKRR